MTAGVGLAGVLLAVADADEGGPGYLALLLIALLAVATVLLVRNMSARLKRLPRSFDPASAKRKRGSRGRSGDGAYGGTYYAGGSGDGHRDSSPTDGGGGDGGGSSGGGGGGDGGGGS